VPSVTALRERQNGRVAVEVDGSPWRELPVDVVVRAGLISGTELDRGALRLLGRELRRSRALGVATRALSRRDLPAQAVETRLQRAGVPEAGRREVVQTLERAGLVDDERFAGSRARALTERGYGDEAIRWRLERDGISSAVAERALAELDPESDRAATLVERRGARRVTALWLARRGFGAEAIESALGPAAGADSWP
jgi:SOS response regulatory protein OraA/RecX